MNVFDYIEKELDRIEVGYTSYDGTKITLTMDEVRELIRNLRKKYQPDGDVISRKAALRLFATHDGKYLYEAIKQLPSAQIKPKWISVNDKLPEEGSPVLLLFINEEIGLSESCRPKSWNQLTDNTIVGWFPIPKETKING